MLIHEGGYVVKAGTALSIATTAGSDALGDGNYIIQNVGSNVVHINTETTATAKDYKLTAGATSCPIKINAGDGGKLYSIAITGVSTLNAIPILSD